MSRAYEQRNLSKKVLDLKNSLLEMLGWLKDIK
jgi:hypothetical protein